MKVDGNTSDGYHTFNELYEHRNLLFVCLMLSHPEISWASKTHDDGTMFDGWFIAGMNLPEGQISYHLPIELWYAVERAGLHKNKQPKWDGHTSLNVLERLSGRVFLGEVNQ